VVVSGQRVCVCVLSRSQQGRSVCVCVA